MTTESTTPAPLTNPPLEYGVVGAIIGVQNSGKTIDGLRAGRFAVITPYKQNVLSAKLFLGIEPFVIEPCPRTIYDLWPILSNIGSTFGSVQPHLRPYDGVFIDDMTVFAKNTELYLKAGGRRPVEPQVDLRNWGDMWVKLVADLWATVDYARNSRMHVIFSGHERKAAISKASGKYVRGGIDLPMDATDSFSALLDFAGRVQRGEESYNPMHGWKAGYWTQSLDPNWAVKSRFQTPDFIPQNIGEVIRSAIRVGAVKVPLRRHVGTEWHEDNVAKWTEKILALGDSATKQDEKRKLVLAGQRQILRELNAKMAERNAAQRDKWWILADVEDRVFLSLYKVNLLGAYD